MFYAPSFRDDLHTDIKPSYLSHTLIEEEIDSRKFGLPRFKKYPMPDAAHVRSAIKFFNYVTPTNEAELARNILARMDEYGIDPETINVGDNNRFKKYLERSTLKHHGIKGQKWGVRRFEDANGHLTPAGKRRYYNDDGTLNNKGRKRYVKKMAKDMENHFMDQLPEHVRKTVRLGNNGYDVRGEAWSSAYRKGLVTRKDDALIRKAAANSRAYAKNKYGESAFKAMQRSGVLFRPIDEFEVKYNQ